MSMSDYVTKIRTKDGDKQIDYNALANRPTPDWNQNDETAADFVKNRPFYTGNPVEKTLFSHGFDIDNLNFDGVPLGLEVGKTYTVRLNEDRYDVVCVSVDGGCFLGNGSLQGMGDDTGEPFVVLESVEYNIFNASVQEDYFESLFQNGKAPEATMEIVGDYNEIIPIDRKYLPVGEHARKGIMSFAEVVSPTGLNISAGETDYASFIKHLRSSAIPIFYLSGHGLGGNSMNALVFSYRFGIVGEIGNEVYCVTLTVFDLKYGFSGNISVRFPLNADNEVDDDSVIEEIRYSAPESTMLKSSTSGSEKKFKITVDDSGTITATELTE